MSESNFTYPSSERSTQIPPDRQPENNFTTNGSVKTLSNVMRVNILLISIVGIASILIMLFGEFDGKGSRVLSTLLVFAAFTTFTGLDSKDHKPDRYMLISQVGNIYLLALSLVYIWGTLGSNDIYEESIVLGTMAIILIIKIAVVLVQAISDYAVVDQEHVSFASFLAATAIAAAGLVFTLPIGLDHIFIFGEGYWKFAVAILMLGGLTISVTALIAWYFKDQINVVLFQGFKKPIEHTKTVETRPEPAPQFEEVKRVQEAPTPASPQNLTAPPIVRKPATAPQFSPPVASSFPWPVFPNGFPLPAKENGRPDFEALKKMSEMYIEGERQFFG